MLSPPTGQKTGQKTGQPSEGLRGIMGKLGKIMGRMGKKLGKLGKKLGKMRKYYLDHPSAGPSTVGGLRMYVSSLKSFG
jgi:hypothetical protein